jgi:hypothetical protein
MTNAILYRSIDVGAPVLTRQVGSIITLLKAILVNGYGSKPSLGWTIEYEDTANKVCVFRMPSGTRMYIQINDNAPYLVGGSTPMYNLARVQAYKTMSSAYLGIEPCPALYQSKWPALVKEVTNSNNATAIPWELNGDDKGFWWIPYANYLTSGGSFSIGPCCGVLPSYVGDYIPFDITNVYNFCIFGADCTAVSNYYTFPIVNNTFSVQSGGFYSVLRDYGFDYGSASAGISNANFVYLGLLSGNSSYPSPSPINGRYIGLPLFVHTTFNQIGVLPGLLGELRRWPSGYTITVSDVAPTVITDGTNKQLIVSSSPSNNWNSVSYVGKQIYNSGDKFRYVY